MMRRLDILSGNCLKMNEEYPLEEVLLIEDFSKTIYDWYCTNKIVNHALSRADFVRAHNQRIQSIFSDLNELRYLLEERKANEAISHYGWMDEEAKELVPGIIVEYIEKLNSEASLTDNEDDFDK
jgi:hypothetical protein